MDESQDIQKVRDKAVSEESASSDGVQLDSRMDASPDMVRELYSGIGENERHFNQIQHQYRVLTSTWLLATFAAIGYVLTKLAGNPIEVSWLASNSELIITAIAVLGAVGIRLLWLLDIKVYHQLLDSCFVEGLKLECDYEWLPQTRKRMLKTQGAQGVLNHVRWFYIACSTVLLAVGGLFLAIWLYKLLSDSNTLVDELVVWGGVLLLVGVAIYFWDHSIYKETRSHALESLNDNSEAA